MSAAAGPPPDAQGEDADHPEQLQAAVTALAGQIQALLPQARAALGEARYAEIAARSGQIRQEALRGVVAKTLLEDKVWLDQALAELLGVVARGLPPGARS